jgi:medium-chain acyl-[acyl-carrier-protein] hydrolase
MESIFEKRLTVTPDYCDASGALSPLAAFTIFQGSAARGGAGRRQQRDGEKG